ncbi:PREDICTED: uncharacterized protein At1g76070-like [Populus euphratica]|uniref:Uncharacterized protein At1g76070-like n=1 Tax=Populus euphratica TaxID=75702 RepID=A0AAJ6U2V8_POPEU|nr:PREDICTED: uncharacterized protein At1g76070-like [Populus euphratica]
MGKRRKSKFSVFACLPQAASPVTFQSPPTSPRMANTDRGLSGRIVSLVPKEARRNARSGTFDDAQEPTSPKVSCTGKVKNKSKKKPQATKSDSCPKPTPTVFKGKKQGLQSDHTSRGRPPVADKPPSLGHMNQFSSNCGVLRDFDWKAHDVSGMPDNSTNSSYDEKNGDKEKVFIVVEVDEDIPREPKKQVELWRRRSRTPPGPLQLEKQARC